MEEGVGALAERLMKAGYDELPAREQRVLRRILRRSHISRDVAADWEGRLTLGERVADRVAAFGGSWPFIFLFGAFILGWVVLNVRLLARPPDPYPFILLNLVLSMVAALQAPVIMMSQNRQAAKDRLTMAHDYEVNLKAELEIMALHEKMDALRTELLQEAFADLSARLAGLEARLAPASAGGAEGAAPREGGEAAGPGGAR
ncbi:MAG: DUF1003 domain-containing protein [Rhodobacteraceae bacterium]|nr:DUF1003 domain-containing protein [Paracoccaceae bacterium]